MNPPIPQYTFGVPATATVRVNPQVVQGTKITLNGTDFILGTDFFGARPNEVARSLAAAINGDISAQDCHPKTNPVGKVFALFFGPTVRLVATEPGTAGNAYTLTTDSALSFTVSGATFSGGVASAISLGGGTQYAEDIPNVSGDVGTLGLVVRKDTAATLAGTDGDYTALQVDANGRLHVHPVIGDGDDAATGAIADAAVAAGATGSISAKLRRLTQGMEDLKTLIVLAAGEAHVGQIGGTLASITSNFTRPANTTAYAALDAVSDSTSAPVCQTFTSAARVSGGSGYIVGAVIKTDQTTCVARFRLHIYNASTPTAINDNAAQTLLWADRAKYLGYLDFAAMSTEGGSNTAAQSYNSTSRLPFVTSGNANLFGLLETLDAFTPANAQNFDIKLLIDQN